MMLITMIIGAPVAYTGTRFAPLKIMLMNQRKCAPYEWRGGGARFGRLLTQLALLPFHFLLVSSLAAQQVVLKGIVIDPQGDALPQAAIQLQIDSSVLVQTVSGPYGNFEIGAKERGEYVLRVAATGFRPITMPLTVHPNGNPEIEVRMSQLSTQITNVTVTADINDLDILSPDPGERVFVRQDLLDANPGRPGAPVSIPGYPIETASGGIKAPQYFAPGIAGDHGEPIAQYIAAGSYLVPNNLSANAHGNGYSALSRGIAFSGS